jgi:hypothetical protein
MLSRSSRDARPLEGTPDSMLEITRRMEISERYNGCILSFDRGLEEKVMVALIHSQRSSSHVIVCSTDDWRKAFNDEVQNHRLNVYVYRKNGRMGSTSSRCGM